MWGVMRYDYGHGDKLHAAEFTGWYNKKLAAQKIYNEWAHKFPLECVMLIKRSDHYEPRR